MSFDRFDDLRFCESRFFHNNHLKLMFSIQLSNGRQSGELTGRSEFLKVTQYQ